MKTQLQGIFCALAIALSGTLNAQSEMAPSTAINQVYRAENPTTQALWDIEFSHNITATTSSVGCAAICYLNGEFWISKWASDTIIRFNAAGVFQNKFMIPGLSGTRSLTTDGTYIYASNNTTTIYRIDPSTFLLAPPHITVGAPVSPRWATYDPTLNSNAGGFWIGNFNTDIYAIDMSGAQLSSISAATHLLTGMYGAAVDVYTVGGPYLWVSVQSGPNTNDFAALSLATGTAITTHDVFPDFAATHSLTSSLAGGAFLTNQFTPGEVTLMTCMQGTPNNVFAGYEVQQPTAPVITNDIELIAVFASDGNTMLPSSHTYAETFEIQYTNNSIAAVDSFHVNFSVINGANNTIYAEGFNVYALAAGGSGTLVSQPFMLPGTDNYTLQATAVDYPLQQDSVSANDTTLSWIAVNDSAFAHDLNNPDPVVTAGVPSTEWGYVITTYTMQVPDAIGGIWIRCTNPNAGDSVAAAIFDTTASGIGNLHAQGPVVFLDGSNWQFLPFLNGVSVNAEMYGFGFFDPSNQIFSLSTESTPSYDVSADYYYTPTTGWQTSGMNESWFIRPLLESAMLHVADASGPSISVFPNPSADVVNVYVGNDEVKTIIIRDMTGKSVKTLQTSQRNVQVDISDLARGTYVLEVSTAGNAWSQSIIKSE